MSLKLRRFAIKLLKPATSTIHQKQGLLATVCGHNAAKVLQGKPQELLSPGTVVLRATGQHEPGFRTRHFFLRSLCHRGIRAVDRRSFWAWQG